MNPWVEDRKPMLYAGLACVLIALCALAALLWGPQ
jgi:hypothetical protein